MLVDGVGDTYAHVGTYIRIVVQQYVSPLEPAVANWARD